MAQNCWRNSPRNTDDQADLSDTQDSDPAGTATANDPSRVNARTCGNVLSESFKSSPSASSQLPAEQAPSLRSSSGTSPSSSPDTVSSDTADADPLEEMLVQQHLRRTQAKTTLASTASEEAKRSFEKIKWRSGGQEGRPSFLATATAKPSFLATATAKGVDADQDATAVQRL